jgi:hypothetical protein
MSSASGRILFSDGLVLHYRYCGTSDTVVSHLFTTHDEMWDNWRCEASRSCSCGQEEDVVCHSDYGGGFTFPGKACRECLSVCADVFGYDAEDATGKPADRHGRTEWGGYWDRHGTHNPPWATGGEA